MKDVELSDADIKLICLTGQFSLTDAPNDLSWLSSYCLIWSNHSDPKSFLEKLARIASRSNSTKFIALIDIECLGGISRSYDLLRGIRDQFPRIAIVIYSDRTTAHDFGTERSAICDATLKRPFTQRDLETAIVSACINNAILQSEKDILIENEINMEA